MATFTEQILNQLDGNEQERGYAPHFPGYQLDHSRVTRVLLRDGWHSVYATSEKDRAGLAETLKNLRRKLDNPDPRNPKTDAEMIAQYPQFIPYRQRPDLQPKPFRKVIIDSQPWAVWNESREPVPVLAEVLVPWHQILALDVEQERTA